MLFAILLLAAVLRLHRLNFGLPALNDPDEPVFIMTAMDMLREGRLNPGWFGHPATLLFYLLALIVLLVGGVGAMLGAWSSADAFVSAVFSDPAVIVLPMRGLSALLGIASVAVTWAIGRRIGGARVGLAAALLLACNPLHVELSQVVRTDMLATVLMGWCTYHALAVAQGGGTRQAVLAGIAAGLACATKWPALLIVVGPVAAGLFAARDSRAAARALAVAPLVAVATLLLASPYILLDYPTVLRDLGGEARPMHLGATGHGFIGNLLWYVHDPLAGSFGIAGLLSAALGAIALARDRANAVVLLPASAVILAALATQSLVWARWIVPLLPVVAILAAIGLSMIADAVRPPGARRLVLPCAALLIAGWMAGATLRAQQQRADDPRQAATRWVFAHVPPGRTILFEHAAFDLLPYRGRLLFPLGSAGCVDIRSLLHSAPSHRKVNGLRQGRAIVDLGNIDPAALPGCSADVAILVNYSRYRAEPVRFAAQLSNYHRLLATHRLVARFSNGKPGNGGTAEIFVRGTVAPPPMSGRGS
ncbi:ArnT family glycosyltransferase [Sphingomonas azotifigens]|uniref:ArnT family glycosyltransferase n=1 Tax=Sphingomonas azotifigens TaxID=330920 RepID=UPI0009FF7A93|nr:glycosyltransferase family 39 protein [Sphingomonas azotifigens]